MPSVRDMVAEINQQQQAAAQPQRFRQAPPARRWAEQVYPLAPGEQPSAAEILRRGADRQEEENVRRTNVRLAKAFHIIRQRFIDAGENPPSDEELFRKFEQDKAEEKAKLQVERLKERRREEQAKGQAGQSAGAA